MAPKIIYLLILLNTRTIVNSCSDTLYLQSDNKICDSLSCEHVHSGLLSLQVGEELCIKDSLGNTTRYRLVNTFIKSMYAPSYTTCDYKLITSSTSRCYQASGSACFSDYCNKNRTNDFEQILKKKTSSTIYEYTGCSMSPLPCRYYCGWNHMGSCTWGLWEIEPDYSSCKTVYFISGQYWISVLEIQTPDGLTRKVPLTQLSNTVINPVYLSVISFSSSFSPKLSDNLIEVEPGIGLSSYASPIDQPVINQLGDIQISLNNKTLIYPKHVVQCTTIGCELSCSMPTPSIRRLKASVNKFNKVPIKYELDNAYTLTEIYGKVSFLIRLKDVIDSVLVETPDCAIVKTYSLGCTGCNVNPRVGFDVKNIKKSGIFRIISNCTLSNYLIPCTTDSFEIEVIGNPDICYIERVLTPRDKILRIPLFNYTFSVNYLFVGDLSNIELLTTSSSELSFTDQISVFASSDAFKYSFIIFTSATFIFVSVIRIVTMLLAYRAGKELSNVGA